MKILYQETLDGICVRRCFSLDGIVQLPNQLEGQPVTELGAYIFSDSMERAVKARGGLKGTFYLWDSDTGASRPVENVSVSEAEGLPAVAGEALQELHLPVGIWKIGAYGFYGCEKLELLAFPSGIRDLGAGVFTGCIRLSRLRVRLLTGQRLYLKEILFELRQDLQVEYLDSQGQLQARLIFPEYYEESVENTPARIIMREMHGCGHMYRYCFDETSFRFREYDSLFPYVRVQEQPSFVTRLALCRLRYPHELQQESAAQYWAYVCQYPAEALKAALSLGGTELAAWLAAREEVARPELELMMEEAASLGEPSLTAVLMEMRRRRFPAPVEQKKKNRFEL